MSESYHTAQLPLFPSPELEAYLAGVIKGDGWCTGYSIGLRVADRDFAEAFAAAITQVFNVPLRIGQERQRYWIVRTSNKTGKYTYLLSLEPTTTSEKAFWLRGLFDSEGNAQLCKLPRGKNSYDRRVSLYSTNTETLNTASRFLTDLAISHRIRSTNNSPGHKGTKCVYELILQASEANFARFQSLIGSSLARKQATLAAIVASYVPDLSESYRRGQLKGAVTRRQKTIEHVLPTVLIGIQELMRRGMKPTFRQCWDIAGYHTVRNHFSHAELVKMAKEKM
jgi:hypothetical protein